MKIIFDSESIFYRHIVVGGVVNCIKYIYGGRTSLFLTSQRMPSRYVLRLQVYRTVEFIGVENICVWYFLGRYYINTALLVIIHILYTQKWASQML